MNAQECEKQQLQIHGHIEKKKKKEKNDDDEGKNCRINNRKSFKKSNKHGF